MDPRAQSRIRALMHPVQSHTTPDFEPTRPLARNALLQQQALRAPGHALHEGSLDSRCLLQRKSAGARASSRAHFGLRQAARRPPEPLLTFSACSAELLIFIYADPGNYTRSSQCEFRCSRSPAQERRRARQQPRTSAYVKPREGNLTASDLLCVLRVSALHF